MTKSFLTILMIKASCRSTRPSGCVILAFVLVKGDLSWRGLAAECPQWYGLITGFVSGYDLDPLERWYAHCSLGGDDGDGLVTMGDRHFFGQLTFWLDMFLDSRRNGLPFGGGD